MRITRSFKEVLQEAFQDPREAHAYLEVAIENYADTRDEEAFLRALQDVSEAWGGEAEKLPLNKQNLTRLLSKGDKHSAEIILRTFGIPAVPLYPTPTRI